MKAAVFYGKEDLRIEELPIPGIKEDEALVRVHGVCKAARRGAAGNTGRRKEAGSREVCDRPVRVVFAKTS